jgi:hypothetical protein
MKYLSMICRGHVPLWKGRVNKDAGKFIRYFLPKGTPADRAGIQTAIRHLHLAFKGMRTEEIYDVLMEQLLRAAAKYDPRYTEKVKEVAEVIDHALSGFPFFRAADIDKHLEFGCHRYLRLLCRRGFLVSRREEEEKRAVYERAETWPPPAEFYGEPIGIADYLSKGFTDFPLGPDRPGKQGTTHPADAPTDHCRTAGEVTRHRYFQSWI